MRGRYRAWLAAAIAVVGVVGLVAIAQAVDRENVAARQSAAGYLAGEGGEPAKEDHEKQEQRELNKRQYSDASGNLRGDLYRKSIADFKKLKIDASRRLPKGKSAFSNATKGAAAATAGGGVVGVQWTQIGPAPLAIDAEFNFQGDGPDAGEVPDIAIDPRNTEDKVVYAAFNDGGLWKTTDGGDNW